MSTRDWKPTNLEYDSKGYSYKTYTHSEAMKYARMMGGDHVFVDRRTKNVALMVFDCSKSISDSRPTRM